MNKFSIEYPEYHIAEMLQHDFKKANHFSVSVPLSRQQKYYDLLLYNASNKKSLAIQVKSSRAYVNYNPKKPTEYHYTAWLNTFTATKFCDYYFIYIPFPVFDLKTFAPKAKHALHLLVFSAEEMINIMENRKLTKSGKQDKFLYFSFNMDSSDIIGTRGFEIHKNFTDNLYLKKLDELKMIIQ